MKWKEERENPMRPKDSRVLCLKSQTNPFPQPFYPSTLPPHLGSPLQRGSQSNVR